MESIKQTAVKWLTQNIVEDQTIKAKSMSEWVSIFKQAKEMEKEQIEDAYDIGFADAWDDAKYDDEPKYAGSEQYYNETYGDKK
jgi:hypothetical protein